MFRTLLTLFLLLSPSPVLAGGFVVAKSSVVTVYRGATNTSEAIGSLKPGVRLVAGERMGLFWKVEFEGGTGFVSAVSVRFSSSSSPTLEQAVKNSLAQGRQEDEQTSQRVRTLVMGVRGLSEDDDVANAGNVRPNLRAVYSMEFMPTVSQKMLRKQEMYILKEIEAKAASGK